MSKLRVVVDTKEDPTDNIFLACAWEGKANCIVSGDKHLLDLERYRGVKILTVKSFLEALEMG